MLADIEAAVAQLNTMKTAPEIATFFVDAGIKGVKDQGTCCPVGRWLRRELSVPYVRVDIEDINVIDDQGNSYTVATPGPVGRFITMFDLYEEFPDLEDEDGPTDEELHTIALEDEVSEQDLREHLYV